MKKGKQVRQCKNAPGLFFCVYVIIHARNDILSALVLFGERSYKTCGPAARGNADFGRIGRLGRFSRLGKGKFYTIFFNFWGFGRDCLFGAYSARSVERHEFVLGTRMFALFRKKMWNVRGREKNCTFC